MRAIIFKRTNIRFFLALALLALIATMFWTSSRYPALGEKAMMGGSIQLEDPLSFEAFLPLEQDFPIWKKIGYTTINWLHTNRQGMFFGVLMGAMFLTLLRYFKRASFRGAFMNSALGLMLGAPLGVCVNCAAPIAKGMYSGGARAETTLSAMLASPTLNIVVLTMLFSILPFYLAVAKIALSLIVILIAVPLICKFLPKEQLQLAEEERRFCPLPEPPGTKSETLREALPGFVKDYLTDLWFIVKMTVPLMVLAGFLGALVATLVPIDLLNDMRFGLAGLLLIALVGTFLPVPIAFDVVITGALLAGGLGIGYVMVLLFTLGIFSIYSFFIIAQSISVRAALLLSVVVILFGASSGIGANSWHKWQSQKALELLTQPAAANDINIPKTALPTNSSVQSTRAGSNLVSEAGTVSVSRQIFADKSPRGEKAFTHREAHQIGIDKPLEFSFKDMWPPFWEGRSISAGDFDNDGDPDLALASTEAGLYIYLNDGKGHFSKKDLDLGTLADALVFNAVLVDLNNDGWLDLFLTTYQTGNFVLWNDQGEFDIERLSPVQNRDDAMLTLALSFADVDRDGDLDAALGNWAAGWYRRIPGDESRNRIVYNEGEMSGAQFSELEGLPGETLSILLTDLNLDGTADLLVGNDFEQPDVYYYGDGNGGFKRIRRQDNIIPFTTTTTMAVKNNDLDNDLVPEIYIAQIAGRSSGVSERLNMQPIEKYCQNIERQTDRQLCEKNMQIKTWYKSGNNFDPSYAHKCLELDAVYQAECRAMLVKDLAIQAEDPSICNLISDEQPLPKAYCRIHFRPIRRPTEAEIQDNYPQIKRRNVLLTRKSDGSYEDQSVARGLEVGGWSWDTKVDDFDNDEWPDMYIVNGTWVPNEVTPSNMYFTNDRAGGFVETAIEMGLDDYLMTAAATKLDIDNDGDLDILTIPVNGPVKAFVNNSQTGNSIVFKIEDYIGNRFGIGTRIVLRYGENNERQQVREIQLGGGFQSFDAPIAHFGLGKYEKINDVKVYWADGSETNLSEPLKSGAIYTIIRHANK
jgi:uncharacterized membrane protein YraQ (UPF0718 family)